MRGIINLRSNVIGNGHRLFLQLLCHNGVFCGLQDDLPQPQHVYSDSTGRSLVFANTAPNVDTDYHPHLPKFGKNLGAHAFEVHLWVAIYDNGELPQGS